MKSKSQIRVADYATSVSLKRQIKNAHGTANHGGQLMKGNILANR